MLKHVRAGTVERHVSTHEIRQAWAGQHLPEVVADLQAQIDHLTERLKSVPNSDISITATPTGFGAATRRALGALAHRLRGRQ